MISLKTQARPYANALFELAVEENACEAWHKILAILSAVIENAEVQAILKIRSIAPKEWITWIQSLKPDFLEKKEVSNLLLLLAEKRRLFLLPTIFQLFEAAWRKLKNEKYFTVIAPAKWDKAQSQHFRDFLSKRFACHAALSVEAHPEMVGGIEVVGEGWRLDYSVKGWLAQLRGQLSG